MIISFMAEFSYKAKRRTGELVEGVLDVADRPAALAQIQRLGLFSNRGWTRRRRARHPAASKAPDKN